MSEDVPRYFTKVEVEIQNFISKYGTDVLISWLAEYSKTISQSDYNMFHRIQKFTCEVYEIPIADINGNTTSNFSMHEAKKIITYLTHQRTKLQNKHISMLQNCTTRTINNHLKEVDFRVKTPQAFKAFNSRYQLILNKLEEYART